MLLFRVLSCATLLFSVLHAQENSSPQPEVSKSATQEASSSFSVIKRDHILPINEKTLNYTSHTGTVQIKNDEGKETASVFFTAYFLKENENTKRPITFCFNGGPGSSSIWLHMGALGPKKVVIKDLANNPPPGRYEDNPYTLLEKSDIVFVDPVSTGFSRASPGIDPKQFYGVEEDISYISEFVRLFVTEYDKWGAPKFLLGESYGTLRVVGLAHKLFEDYHMNINGLVLISSCLDLASFDSSNELSYILSLPSFTAAAWYHKRLSTEYQQKELDPLLDEVEQFAINEYAHALLVGDSLAPEKKNELIKKLSNYTGLSEQYIRLSNMRVRENRFFNKLLADEQKIIGRFDTRYTGSDLDIQAEYPGYDPSFDTISGNFTSAFLDYASCELGWKKETAYRVLTPVVHPWNWGLKNQPAGMGYLNLADHLKSMMTRNPNLQVFIASGLFDLATPYFATDYTADHLQLDESLKKNVMQSYYHAGHMMYIHPESLIKLHHDLEKFIEHSIF